MHNAGGKDDAYYKENSFLEQCFARPSIDIIGWYLQIIFKLTSADISLKYRDSPDSTVFGKILNRVN